MANPTLKVMSTLGVLAPLRDSVLPEYRRATGHLIEIDFSPTNVLAREIDAGRHADVIIAIDGMVQGLIDSGILQSPGAMIASTSVGLAKRIGTAPLAMATQDEFIDVLLSAKSIAISETGASGVFFRALIERLGIADRILAKARIIPQGLTATLLLQGEAELAVQQVSELRAVDGIDVVGPLPPALNQWTSFTAAAFRGANRPDIAADFLSFLVSDFARSAYVAGGLDVPENGSARKSG